MAIPGRSPPPLKPAGRPADVLRTTVTTFLAQRDVAGLTIGQALSRREMFTCGPNCRRHHPHTGLSTMLLLRPPPPTPHCSRSGANMMASRWSAKDCSPSFHEVGRPATGRDPVTGVRMPQEVTTAIDVAAAADAPSRSELIRGIVVGLRAGVPSMRARLGATVAHMPASGLQI